MPDPIFERYKEALKAGHVAALRGNPDQALVHYRAAVSLAPDRALPYASMADVLGRLGRRDEALAACGRALELAPRDEPVLDSAARVYAGSGRAADAADCLDRLVDVLLAAGRLDDACQAAARAVGIKSSPARRDRAAEIERAAAASRAHEQPAEPAATGGPEAGGAAATAGRPPGEPEPGRGSGVASRRARHREGDEVSAGPVEAPAARAPSGAPIARAGTTPGAEVGPGERRLAGASSDEAGAAAGPASPGNRLVAPETSTAGAAARPDPEVLFAGAEECAVTGDAGGAARLYAQAAEAYLAMGAADTAVDACLRALAGAPGDTGVHLALARVHLASGHADRADKKLRLLRRLRELDDDAEATARVDRFRETHLPMG